MQYKSSTMKISERYLWIGALIVSAFFVQGKLVHIDRLSLIIESYKLEGEIQNSQISDFHQQLLTYKSAEYNKGFENGRTQAGVAFSQGRPMLGYSDGYHAALKQFNPTYRSEEEKLLSDLDKDREKEEAKKGF